MCHCDVAAGEQVDGFCAAKGADGVVLGDGTGAGKADVAGSAGRCAAKGDVRAGFYKDVAGRTDVTGGGCCADAAAGDKDKCTKAGGVAQAARDCAGAGLDVDAVDGEAECVKGDGVVLCYEGATAAARQGKGRDGGFKVVGAKAEAKAGEDQAA